MVAPYYQFAPLSQHFDGGLGATGDAFKEAGDKLSRRRRKGALYNPHLPQNFLYRHAIELYLKSVVVILHRVLDLGKEGPKITVGGKASSIYRVHQISSLYAHLKSVLNQNEQRIKAISGFGPKSLSLELDGWIRTIADADDSSTYFRYPSTDNQQKNHEKSSFKSISPIELAISTQAAQPKQFSLAFVDEDGAIKKGFQLDQDPIAQVGQALKRAVSEFSGIHFGVRMEFSQGW